LRLISNKKPDQEIFLALFANRSDAGRKLAQVLMGYKGHNEVIVLALPRGGVPVAYEVARALEAPLDIFLVRKLGVPGQEELAMGAIASGGVRVLNPEVIRALGIPGNVVQNAAEREQHELERREREYRDDRLRPDLHDKMVILVDDGLATGASMRAAVEGVRAQEPDKIVVAVPTGAAETCQQFELIADEVICATTPQPFQGVGIWYEDFGQTSDEEVRDLLRQANRSQSLR
jgi:putative phosphoribosyl transferase